MGKKVITEKMFPEIVGIYNNEGKTAAYDLLRSKYGIKQPYFVMDRIKNSEHYEYDSESDRFNSLTDSIADDVFMDFEELCSGAIIKPDETKPKLMIDDRKPALETLINELINDRLLTLSRYITMDSASRTILIDQTSLSQDGYRIITH